MAQIITFSCDKCKKSDVPVTSHRVNLDGNTHTIDLCEKDLKPLQDLIALGEEVVKPDTASKGDPRNTKIREWARSNSIMKADGTPVMAQGALPADIIAKYEAAHPAAA
jgi:hypothetical protein